MNTADWRQRRIYVHSATGTYIHGLWAVRVVYSPAEQGLSSQVLDTLQDINGSFMWQSNIFHGVDL
jgi:hypothetical protein